MSVYEQHDDDEHFLFGESDKYEEKDNQLTDSEQYNQDSEQQSLPKQQQQQTYTNVELNISISCRLQISNIDEINSTIQNLQKQLHQFQNCENISISHQIQEIKNQNIQFYQQEQLQEQNQFYQPQYQNYQSTQKDQNNFFEKTQQQSYQIHQQYSNNLSNQQQQFNQYSQSNIKYINNNKCFTNEINNQYLNNIQISQPNKQILINDQSNDNQFLAYQQMYSLNASTKQISQQSTNISNDLHASLNESEQLNQIENNENFAQNDQQVENMFGELSLQNSNIEDHEIHNEQYLFNYQQEEFQNYEEQYCDQDGQQLQNNSVYEPHTNNNAEEINQETTTNTYLQYQLNQEQIEQQLIQTNENQQASQSQKPKKIKKTIQRNPTKQKQNNNDKQPNQKNNNPNEAQDPKRKEKKNNCSETHNVPTLMIGYLYSYFQNLGFMNQVRDIPIKKNLNDLNIIINEIHDQLGQSKYQQFCYRSIQCLKMYARKSTSKDAFLMQKYVHSFEFIMRNPHVGIYDIKDLLKNIKEKITQQPQYIYQQQ